LAGRRTRRIIAIGAALAALALLWTCARGIGSFGGGSGGFDQKVLVHGPAGGRIVMIDIVGEIFSDPGGSAGGASDTSIIAQLDRAADDRQVKGVILNEDTPGGGVVASDAIYRRVLKLRKQGKPVIALMGDTSASGGYYIASGADEIVASPYTWTGSIGVIAMLPNFEKAAGKVGIGVTVVKSGAFKDAGSPFRALTDQEKALFQALIDEAYARFVDVVSKGRGLDPARTRELADGRIYSGLQAKKLGLVDRLGGQDVAFARAKSIAKAKGASLVHYAPHKTVFQSLISAASQSKADVVLKDLGITRRPGAAYLWLP
jgi:protease-4